jgi:glycosyltransferase involved in cell wall biosynthesis
MRPKYSVITPVYNRAYLLWNTVLAMQRQLYPLWEMIIVDDGSTDDTRKMLSLFQDDPRIRYVSQTNQSPAAARNLGTTNLMRIFSVH